MANKKSIMLLITYSCNLHCSYCYEPKLKGFRMSVDKAKQIITERLSTLDKECDTLEIQFMGGEPFLEFPLMKDVSEWLWTLDLNERELVVFSPTNGTILTDEIRQWLTANKDRFTVGLSFDGDETMQDLNRSKSSEKVDLTFFANTWPEQSVKMTISPDTVMSLADGVIHLHDSGFRFITADLAMGDRIEWTRDSLTIYKEQLAKLARYYINHPELTPFSMLSIDVSEILRSKSTYIKSCGCGETLECVDWTGESYACHLFSPVALPIEKARKSRELYDFHNHASFENETCHRCALNAVCIHCYGMNYICNGDIKQPSPFHCSAFKIRFIENCKFQLMLAEKDNDIKHQRLINRVINNLK